MYPHLRSTLCTVFIFGSMNEIPPSPSIHSFSFISSSNLVHMVCLTISASDTLNPAHFVQLPANEGPPSLPASAAAGA